MEAVLPPESESGPDSSRKEEGSWSGEDVVSSHVDTSTHKASVVIGRLMAVIAGIVVALFLIASLIATAARIFG
jgi:hypothetical protein